MFIRHLSRPFLISLPFWFEFGQQISLAQETSCLTNHPADDRYGVYLPDGSGIAFESNRDGNWEIYLTDKNPSAPLRLTHHDSIDRSPFFFRSGKKIIFESNRSGKFELYEMNVSTHKIRKMNVPECPGDLLFPAYAPSGKNIACTCQESQDKSNIIVINQRGKIIKHITFDPFRSFFPRWSPDAKKIAYFSRKDTGNRHDEIYFFDVRTGSSQRITQSSLHRFCPSFSPDGEKIAMVASMENKRPEILIMDISSGKTWQLTDNDTGDTLPVFHPDGHKLLITTFRNGNSEVCEIPVVYSSG